MLSLIDFNSCLGQAVRLNFSNIFGGAEHNDIDNLEEMKLQKISVANADAI